MFCEGVVMKRRAPQGFTLIELAMIIVILGVLAVAIVPRMTNRETFEARGFFDQAQAAVRYAQKAAIAQRRVVHVNLTANAMCLTYVADPNCVNTSASDIVLSPASGQRFYKDAPSGVTFNTIGSFSFNALGRPSAAQVIGVTGDGMTRTILVESETGYVH
jgi:MSHA pilin protein MshC